MPNGSVRCAGLPPPLGLALTAADWSTRAAADVHVSRQPADMRAASVAEWNGDGELDGGHGDWAGQWAGLRADSEEDMGKSAEMAEAAAAKEGEAARGLRHAAAAAMHAAAAVAAAEAESGRSSPDMQEAVAAWNEAVAAAGRTEEDCAADQAEQGRACCRAAARKPCTMLCKRAPSGKRSQCAGRPATERRALLRPRRTSGQIGKPTIEPGRQLLDKGRIGKGRLDAVRR